MSKDKKYTNKLIDETSPYLLQHAYNPVAWYPWGEEALAKAKAENKMLLVSVGYSACHWCHVMERECFENEEVAALMNEYFINIKVDREERPDIDQVYMSAVQLMTGRGGWPLNCITLPDGRPIYGGTYFPKDQWMNILKQMAEIFIYERERANDYAAKLTEGVALSGLAIKSTTTDNNWEGILNDTVAAWIHNMDNVEGGPARAPKFPLPNNYLFLLRYANLYKNEGLLSHVNLTLKKMAYGGIYDQVGGGFARYSVDGFWKVPHFEKMLYDNAQLVSLYAEAYKATGIALYKEVVDETLGFIARELTSSEGLFYSALDADSEGEEGKFYVWKKEEIEALLGADFALFADYYNINDEGFWEHGNYILLRKEDEETIAAKHGISVESLKEKVSAWKGLLLTERAKRVRPGLDDKSLASWNALMIRGYADAYKYLGTQAYLDTAIAAMQVFESKYTQADGLLYHNYKEGRSTINGFLEDYCFAIDAYVALYENTFEAGYINKAVALAESCYAHFADTQTGMFFFTPASQTDLIARKMEVHDNVIPASNSALARSLYTLFQLTGTIKYRDTAMQMLNNIAEDMPGYGGGYSNWGLLALQLAKPFYEVVITGDNAMEFAIKVNATYLQNTLVAAAKNDEPLDVFKGRQKQGETLVYVCQNNTCQAPVKTVAEALSGII